MKLEVMEHQVHTGPCQLFVRTFDFYAKVNGEPLKVVSRGVKNDIFYD